MNKVIKTKKLIVAFSFLFAFLFMGLALLVNVAFGTHTNIIEDGSAGCDPDTYCQWAWNDARGWINFHNVDTTADVTATRIEGFAVFEDTANDYISFDCETSPDSSICDDGMGNGVSYSVFNDGDGNLSGWAWNDGIGWISFCGGTGEEGEPGYNPDCPGDFSYQVTIGPSSGDFSGWAWNDVVGWISFCGGSGTTNCPGTTWSYKVKTSHTPTAAEDGWLISNTFDTEIDGGAGYNSIMWIGELPSGGSVRFKFATSDCENGGATQQECDDQTGASYWGTDSSPYEGPDEGNPESYYEPSGSDKPTPLGNHHNNKTYYRYKIFLNKDQGYTEAPVVEDVIINWSR